jgi:hypothetical protein
MARPIQVLRKKVFLELTIVALEMQTTAILDSNIALRKARYFQLLRLDADRSGAKA